MDNLNKKRALYPRVSDIISQQYRKGYSTLPLDTLIKVFFKESKIHHYCTSWLKKIEISNIEIEYMPYFNAFTQWAKNNIEECMYTEITLYDDVHQFSGAFDLIVKLKHSGRIALIDLKTSPKNSKTWPIELAAYYYLCKINKYPCDLIMNVQLKMNMENKEGTFFQPIIKALAIEYDNPIPYWQIFSNALNCYNYFNSVPIHKIPCILE